ncbi:MAG: S8 family serine peptidase [Chitinispirillia bacterium]|nr:S8 family serine peptidase [Chitinispirillia bacterium]
MKKNNAIYLLAALICAFALSSPAYSSPAAGLSKALSAVAGSDTVCNVWVFFNDRPARSDAEKVSERAVQRRRLARYRPDDGDRPVHRRYISEVERLGGRLRNEFPWGNAASFSVHASRLSDIAALPFVKSVSPVAVYVNDKNIAAAGLYKSAASAPPVTAFDPGYGWHMDMVNVPLAHEYIRIKGLGNPGEGVFLAFFDGGFRFEHVALQRVKDSGLVVAEWDFVDNDSTVFDPDSVVSDSTHRFYGNDSHGTQVVALVAGYHPGYYIGGAWGARFAAARTEDDGVESRVEEDNWAAAMVWAESLGVDIVSSSLGYRDGFTDPDENYGPSDMDGRTTVVALAAAGAVERGVIVVNSAGNESIGANPTQTLTSPADVDGVTAVGAVDRSRILASFSSVGPTADGRMKPDLSAPGVWVPVLDKISMNTYTGNNGTSFSTPIVSSIFALILQANPGISAAEARERLYASCFFAAGQTFANNRHGRGIPNAMRAVMQDDEIFIRLVDTLGAPLAGAQVRAGGNIYTANEFGCVLISARAYSLPLDLGIIFRGDSVSTYTISSLPFEGTIDFGVSRDAGLKVRPSVVRKSSVVKGKYYFTTTNLSAPATAIVHTLDGRKVWEEKITLRPDGSAEFLWDCKKRSRMVSAGVYFVTVRHGTDRISGRVIIAK